MSLLTQFAQTEMELKQLQEKLEKMENDPRLQAELEFKTKLEQLMKEFDKSAADVIALIDPARAQRPATEPRTRRKRKLKVYQHPDTGEIVETRGGNQKTLKAWKDEFGDETVEGWLVRTED